MCNHAGRECATQWVLQLYSELSCTLASDMAALTSMVPTHRKVIGYNKERVGKAAQKGNNKIKNTYMHTKIHSEIKPCSPFDTCRV